MLENLVRFSDRELFCKYKDGQIGNALASTMVDALDSDESKISRSACAGTRMLIEKCKVNKEVWLLNVPTVL